MIFFNGNAEDLRNAVLGKRLYFWGIGEALSNLLAQREYMDLVESIESAIDSKKRGSCRIGGRDVQILPPESLFDKKNAFVFVVSTRYYLDIYSELKEMSLTDEITVGFYYLIHRFPTMSEQTVVKKALQRQGRRIIPKVIHTFWFSGETVPQEYQRCVHSWQEYCPEYEIRVWDQDNYDCQKNSFVKAAIEDKRWAFAADYARLDVLYRYGGIYMDMDIELFRSLDDFLKYYAVFVHNSRVIDLAFFSSVKGNRLLYDMLSIYENTEYDNSKQSLRFSLIQPQLVKDVFYKRGVVDEDAYQQIDGMLFLPGYTMFPWHWFDWSGKPVTDTSYGIHHCNAGWFEQEDKDERWGETAEIADLWEDIMRGNDKQNVL